MPRPSADRQAPASAAVVVSPPHEGPSSDERLRVMATIRSLGPESSAELDRTLLRQIYRLYNGLDAAKDAHAELKRIVDKLTAPPWHPGVYIGAGPGDPAPTAVVAHGSTKRVVVIGESVQADSLSPGDDVLLSHDLNLIVARLATRVSSSGEVAAFGRWLPDGRMVLSVRDEEIVTDAAGALTRDAVSPGDLVRWDRSVGMAFERVERAQGADAFFEEPSSVSYDDIGGLDEQIEELDRTVLLSHRYGPLAQKYGLAGKRRSVLLWGPPGTGKTLLVRALVSRLRSVSPNGQARFMNIRPSALNSMWFAQSERNYREVFRAAREAGAREPDVPVVLYFDEIDAIGSTRGTSLMRPDDRVLLALASELDGCQDRGNVLIVSSTNRRDALDPALVRPGRLGDCVIHVPAPNRRAARAILGKHLRSGLPYATHGDVDAGAARDIILDAAIARLFAPNADAGLAIVMFRDGTQRVVMCRDLLSGAVLAQVAALAIERACVREADTGAEGLCLDDVTHAIEREMPSLARVLTPANCRHYLSDLPQDVDVVAVTPAARRVPNDAYLTRGQVA